MNVEAVPTTLDDLPDAAGQIKYPWRTMAVGNHFVWPGTKHAAYVATARTGKRLKKKFAVRTVDGKITVWRME